MDVRYTVGRNEYRRMTTEELRAAFLNTALCEAGKVKAVVEVFGTAPGILATA